MTLSVDRFTSAGDFLAAAGEFLVAREAEHNLLLGIAGTLRDHPEALRDPRFAVVRDGSGRVLAATVHTRPWNLVLSEVDEPDAVDALVDGADPDLRGVTGPTAAARRFADRFAAATGRAAELETAERIFEADHVAWPRPVGGAMRAAVEGDRRLIQDWYLAFSAEATPTSPPPDDLDAMVDRWLVGIGRRIYLWEDGEVVSMAGAGGETPNGTRIGPVYTPPEARGRGYASNLTAALTDAQLEAGRRFCFLFTDLANPTSNRIYQAIGYRPVTDVDMYRFIST